MQSEIDVIKNKVKRALNNFNLLIRYMSMQR